MKYFFWRKTMKRTGFAIIAVLLVISGIPDVFAGGSQAPAQAGETITLEYWSSWNSTEPQAQVLQEAATAYTKLNPTIRINYTFNGRDNRMLIGPAIEAGTKIDLFDMNCDNLQLLALDKAMSLDKYYGEVYPTTNGKPFVDCLVPSMVRLVEKIGNGSKPYVPFLPASTLFFYNKEIFKAAGVASAPRDWDQFLEACEKIKRAGYIPLTFDDAYATFTFGYIISRLKGSDWLEKLVTDETKALWNDPACFKAAQMISDLWNKGYYAPNVGSNKWPAGQLEMVIGEKIAMYLNGTWLPNETKDTAKQGFQWGEFAFPAISGGVDGTEAGGYNSSAIAINKACDEKTARAAFSYAVFITTGEWDKTMSVRANAIPISIGVDWPAPLAEAQGAISAFVKRYPRDTSIEKNQNMKKILMSNLIVLASGKMTPEQFIVEVKK
jgi:raffinose/stachyose/melibiose transport system substrate-binding protein